KFPKAPHLYMRERCWSDSAVAPVHSPRPALAAAPVPSPRPALAAEPVPPSRPALAAEPVPPARAEIVNSGIDSSDINAGAQCRYSPCEWSIIAVVRWAHFRSLIGTRSTQPTVYL